MRKTIRAAHTWWRWTSPVGRVVTQFLIHVSPRIPRRVTPYRASSTYRTHTTKVVRHAGAYQDSRQLTALFSLEDSKLWGEGALYFFL